MVWPVRFIITLITFVQFFCIVCFKCTLKLLGSEEAKSHWLHLFGFYPLCVFKCVLKLPSRIVVNSQWLHLFVFFSTVRLQMSPQTGSTNKFIATLDAFVWFFSTVGFPQITLLLQKWFFFFLFQIWNNVFEHSSDATAHKELLLDTKSLG